MKILWLEIRDFMDTESSAFNWFRNDDSWRTKETKTLPNLEKNLVNSFHTNHRSFIGRIRISYSRKQNEWKLDEFDECCRNLNTLKSFSLKYVFLVPMVREGWLMEL